MRFNELIQKWLTGNFRRSDETALREAGRNDDFVREATEGYIAFSDEDHQVRLDRMRNKLRGSAGDIPVLQKNRTKWWAAAAALAVLIASVWVMRLTVNREDKTTFSQAIEHGQPSENAARTNAEGENEPKQNQELNAKAADNETIAIEKIETRIPQNHATKPQGNTEPQREIQTSPAKHLENTRQAEAPSNQEFAASEPALAETKKETIAEMDAVRIIEYAPPDKRQQTPVLDSSQKSKITQNQTEPQPDSIAFDINRQRSDLADSVLGAGAFANMMPTNPYPLAGWDEYNRYLRINARLTSEALNNNVSGKVRLRFSVGENGEPVNITVLESLGYGCDEEAKRLVREGGLWQIGISHFVTLDVPFVR